MTRITCHLSIRTCASDVHSVEYGQGSLTCGCPGQTHNIQELITQHGRGRGGGGEGRISITSMQMGQLVLEASAMQVCFASIEVGRQRPHLSQWK